ncbi:MAG: endonuclease/exonuclease/phosphatase family protein [Microthrixaceae bacterium]
MALRLGTWNTQWATPSSRATSRGRAVAERLAGAGCDVLAATEVLPEVLPPGHLADAGRAWGYPVRDDRRRKLVLWSAEPWQDVQLGEPGTPLHGRYVRGTTETPIGAVTVVGVCIPWPHCHVTTGRKDRARWDEHLEYLRMLRPVLARISQPLIVAGDFNQRIPRTRQPHRAADALAGALGDLVVPTSAVTEPRLIDHIAHTADLDASHLTIIPGRDGGRSLSDHDGVVVQLRRAPGPVKLGRPAR